jgi:hypothetical protein
MDSRLDQISKTFICSLNADMLEGTENYFEGSADGCEDASLGSNNGYAKGCKGSSIMFYNETAANKSIVDVEMTDRNTEKECKLNELGSMDHKLQRLAGAGAHPRHIYSVDLEDLSGQDTETIPITFLHHGFRANEYRKVWTQEEGMDAQDMNANTHNVFGEFDQPWQKKADSRCSAMPQFAWVLILGRRWGAEDMGNWRLSVPCAMFLYSGDYDFKHLAANIKSMGKGSPVVLDGASDHCYGWSGWTHELLELDLPNEPFGYGCFNCKELAIVSQDLMRCANCKFCKYCSVSCQKKHWKTHKNECNEIANAFKASGRRKYRQTYYGILTKEQFQRWRSILDDVAVHRHPNLPLLMRVVRA